MNNLNAFNYLIFNFTRTIKNKMMIKYAFKLLTEFHYIAVYCIYFTSKKDLMNITHLPIIIINTIHE